jgi:hypothetical protein
MQSLFSVVFEFDYDIESTERAEINAANLLKKIENQNERIKKPDVVAICTNYTHRIQDNKWITTHKNVAFVQNDLSWRPNGSDLIIKKRGKVRHNTKMLEHTSKVAKEGCIGLVDFEIKNLFEFVDDLGDLQFCGCCDGSNIDSVEWFKMDDGCVVALVSVNTESG